MSAEENFLLTVDVEDWSQSTFDNSLPINEISNRNTDILLELLSQYSAKATMFVLGKFAQKFPETIKKIKEEGHEIASHGLNHISLFRMSQSEFKRDLNLSKKIIEDIIGERIIGFRAPDFSIGINNLNYLYTIREEGFEYDSSIFPIKLKRYGISNWPNFPTNLSLGNGMSIIEFPIGISRFLNFSVPVGGGGYHRLFPLKIILYLIKKSFKRNPYFVFYCHPYEFNYKEFKELNLKMPLLLKIKQGYGRKNFLKKFKTLLEKFKPIKIEDLIKRNKFERMDLDEIQRNKIS